jgi:hypothetical protein
MRRGTIITTIAALQSRPLVTIFSVTLMLLLMPMLHFFFADIIILSEQAIFITSHQAWAFAPTQVGNNNTSVTLNNNNTISSTNQIPVADYKDNVTTNQNTPVNITLSASDTDNDQLQFIIVRFPLHGSLSGTTPNLVYIPQQDYVGTDSFTYKANDGKADSNSANVTINVRQVNNPPSASVTQNGAVSTNEPAFLKVIVRVNNTGGGTAVPSDFDITVIGDNVSPSNFKGSDNGTIVSLAPGDFYVMSSKIINGISYGTSFSGDCAYRSEQPYGGTGAGHIRGGERKTCIVTEIYPNFQ